MTKVKLMEFLANPEIEELSDLFPCSHVNISSLYDKFGFWETYHIMDLVCNDNYDLAKLLNRMNKHSLTAIVSEVNKRRRDEGDDITEIFLRDAIRFYPTKRAPVAANIFYADTAEDDLNSGHFAEHQASRIGDY